MKKFNANELLSRDEMKGIQGSGYGCSTTDCYFSFSHTSSCNFDFVKNKCICKSPRNADVDC